MVEREVTLDRTQIMKALRGLGRGETEIDSLPSPVTDMLTKA